MLIAVEDQPITRPVFRVDMCGLHIREFAYQGILLVVEILRIWNIGKRPEGAHDEHDDDEKEYRNAPNKPYCDGFRRRCAGRDPGATSRLNRRCI